MWSLITIRDDFKYFYRRDNNSICRIVHSHVNGDNLLTKYYVKNGREFGIGFTKIRYV
jgi:hypothetical protein